MTPPLIYLVAGILLGCIGRGLFGAVCARILMQRLRRELIGRLQEHEESLRKALTVREGVPSSAPDLDEARMTKRLQQAMAIEIESLAQRQSERDARHANDLRALVEALEARRGKAMTHAATTRQAAAKEPSPASARPPALTHAPLPRSGPAAAPDEPERELSDEEIDALPPELPAPGKPRKRIQHAPTRPPLRSI
ncbi:hypothetical protein WKW77_06505 [Variovorax ureilyticus]|uniref:Uncharacterized protein n=1 Tax=Variovorax ureilyticus TaxID=1836198 RepID=A0ABU8VAQ3_9BURK